MPDGGGARDRAGAHTAGLVAGSAFVVGLAATIVTTALPQIAAGAHVPPLALSGLVSAYLLGVAIFTPLSGWLTDRIGVRSAFVLANLAFLAGSLVCGATSHPIVMICGRLVQAFGAAVLGPLGQVILFRSYPRSEVVRVTGYTVMASQLGPLIAPFVGAFVAQWLGWRWIFLLNAPLSLAAVALGWRLLGADEAYRRPVKFDLVGFACLAGLLGLLHLAVARAGAGWSASVALMLAGAVLLGALYAWRASRRPHALLDFGLLRRRVYAVSVLPGGVFIAAIATMAFLLPLMLQIGLGQSPMQAANHLLVITAAIILFRGFLPGALRRLGFRTLLALNGLAIALAIMGFAAMDRATPGWVLLGYMLVFGALRSFHWSNLNTLGYAELSEQEIARAAPLTAVANQVAQMLGVGAAGAALDHMAAGGQPDLGDFHRVLLGLGLASLGALSGFALLRADDGAAVSGRRPRSS